jgi:uncharacterized protein YnzC (UPF0291/DUF896 family)
MVTKEQIDRINFLYHKSKTAEGLTMEEKEEQALLRKFYIDSVKVSLKSTLSHTKIKEPDGRVINVADLYRKNTEN